MTIRKVDKEAELQARLESRIRAAFPLLPAQIKLEHYLHLRLGHHRIIIDGTESDKSSTCGRYDVLVLVDDKPLLIAELKVPGIIVGEDDVKQALSYARLHDPMVPLVLVTNGENTIVRRTYDGKEIEFGEGSAENFTSILNSAATLAAAASEDAIRTLLGSSKDTWRQVFAAWNSETIVGKTGSVTDFRYPIIREFSVPREAVSQLHEALSKGAHVVVLHGPPLCGVTNVLAQFAQVDSLEPKIFIDGKAAADVFQFIANRLSRELSFGVSKDDIRSWFNTGRGLANIVVIVDGFPKEVGDELIDYANGGLFKLVIGMGSESYRQTAVVAGRVEGSLLGLSAVKVELLPLSDSEFNNALHKLAVEFDAYFFNGAQHISEMRWPRRLRVIAAILPEKNKLPPELDRSIRLMLPPIPGPLILEQCSRAFGHDPKLKFDLQKIAKSFLADAEQHIGDAEWFIATWGRPLVNPDILYQILGEQGVERFCENGFLSWADTPNIGQRLLVRVEELLAHHVADEWLLSLSNLVDNNAITLRLKELLRLAEAIPTGDLALAAAIFRATKLNSSVLGVAIQYLTNQIPKTTKIKKGSRVDILVKGGRIPLLFDVEMEEELVGEMLPWLVLSHIASWPMAVEGYELTANYSIFTVLGSSQHLIYQPKPCDIADVPKFHFHEIEGFGSLPCIHGTGIVEPLMQSMLAHMHNFPDEMVLLANHALKEKEIHLAWRLMAVAINAEDSTDKAVELAAKGVKEVLKDWWQAALKGALTSHLGCKSLSATRQLPAVEKKLFAKRKHKKKRKKNSR